VAKAHFFDKLLRAVKRKPHAHAAFINPIGLRLDIGEMLQVDLDRFNRCISALGSALYFHRFKEKLRSKIHVISPNLYAQGQGTVHVPTPYAAAIDVTRQFLASAPIGGENQEVFMYRTRYEPESDMYAFAAIFYGAFEVFGATQRTTTAA
jgi:hypothetical protein